MVFSWYIFCTLYILFCRIFEEIYLKAPHILKDVPNIFMGFDNEEYVCEQIDFKKSK